LALPKELDETFWERMNQYEEAQRMPYITSVERIGMEKGIEKGMERGLVRMLQLRFGIIPDSLLKRLQGLDVPRLEELMGVAMQADSLGAFAQALELEPA
jgi:hypothetical protein